MEFSDMILVTENSCEMILDWERTELCLEFLVMCFLTERLESWSHESERGWESSWCWAVETISWLIFWQSWLLRSHHSCFSFSSCWPPPLHWVCSAGWVDWSSAGSWQGEVMESARVLVILETLAGVTWMIFCQDMVMMVIFSSPGRRCWRLGWSPVVLGLRTGRVWSGWDCRSGVWWSCWWRSCCPVTPSSPETDFLV